MFSHTSSVRVIECGDGLTEERTVTLGKKEYPLLHALLRKKLWLKARCAEKWNEIEQPLG